MYSTFPDLLTAYLDSLKGRSCYACFVSVARGWASTLTETPTRGQILLRQRAICAGHFKEGAAKANKELGFIRAACRWGIYNDCWAGGDPTIGVKKWKTAERLEPGKEEDLRKIRDYFLSLDMAHAEVSDTEIRDRALMGLTYFTGARPIEARMALLGTITPYGPMACWKKDTTKNGRAHEVPVPSQYLPWLSAWLEIRPRRPNPYIFPGEKFGAPLTDDAIVHRWEALCEKLEIQGLWYYDLRRTIADKLGNVLEYDAYTIRAILNHHEGSALKHYYRKSFDALTKPIQHYADWLFALKHEPLGLRAERRTGERLHDVSTVNGTLGISRNTSATATAVLDEVSHPSLLNGHDTREAWEEYPG